MKKQIIPFYFRIERNGKISDILGTSHNTSFEALPIACQQQAKSANILVSEHACFNMLEKESCYVVRTADEPIWYQSLLPSSQEIVQNSLKLLNSTIPAEQLSYFALMVFAMAGDELLGMDRYLRLNFIEKNLHIHALDDPDLIHPSCLSLMEMQDKISKFYKEFKCSQPDNDAIISMIEQAFRDMQEPYEDEEYLSGDINLASEDQDDDPFMEKCHAIQRNYSWMPKILKLHESQPEGRQLIAVGYGHLFGKDGMLQLLIESGFKITRMDTTGEFVPYGEHYADRRLADDLILQQKCFSVLRDQILGRKPLLAWSFNSQQDSDDKKAGEVPSHVARQRFNCELRL